ncbi:MAG: hypothetical protein ACYDH9_23285 [Limisphaerales bacterium]
MRTTVDLPNPLFKRVKSAAALRGLRLRQFVADALEQALEAGRPAPRRHRVKLPLIRGAGKRIINPSRQELDASLWG